MTYDKLIDWIAPSIVRTFLPEKIEQFNEVIGKSDNKIAKIRQLLAERYETAASYFEDYVTGNTPQCTGKDYLLAEMRWLRSELHFETLIAALRHPNFAYVTHGHKVSPNRCTVYFHDESSPSGVSATSADGLSASFSKEDSESMAIVREMIGGTKTSRSFS